MMGEAERFWRFSLHFYGLPDVREACLALQDEGGLNVNLVLWCCWQAAQGRALAASEIEAAAARIDGWSGAVTQPLRALRRRVKAGAEENLAPQARAHLYERLKAAELESEKVEQALICRGAAPGREMTGGPVRNLAKGNLHAYMGIAGAPGSGRLREMRDGLADRLASPGGRPDEGGF
ncbi:MAG: TIGR02444 family protein [bacterium]